MAARRRKNANEPEGVAASDEGREASNGASPLGMRVKKKGRWWQCGPVKIFLIVFLAIFILNYGSLKREYTHLMPPGN